MEALFLLALLACPVGMGLMMWFMMKANRQQGGTPAPYDKATGHAGFTADPRQNQVDALRAEVEDLRARLDSRPAPADPERTR